MDGTNRPLILLPLEDDLDGAASHIRKLEHVLELSGNDHLPVLEVVRLKLVDPCPITFLSGLLLLDLPFLSACPLRDGLGELRLPRAADAREDHERLGLEREQVGGYKLARE